MVMKLAAEQASTSGTAIDFTGIPAGTSMIVVMLNAVSSNGTGHMGVRLGTVGGIDSTADYQTPIGFFQNAGTVSYSAGDVSYAIVGIGTGNADNAHRSVIIFTLEDASDNTWMWTGTGGANGTTPHACFFSGRKALSGVLDRVRIITGNGDTFDAGTVSISYF